VWRSSNRDAGTEEFLTNEYSSSSLNGWRQDIFALGRTFITLHTGSMDTELELSQREWLSNSAVGDRLMRLVDRMLQTRMSEGRKAHPTARSIHRQTMRFISELSNADPSEPCNAGWEF
jgi:hypothetical protein